MSDISSAAAAGNYTNSTLFVDIVGPLSGTNATNFSSNSVSSSLTNQTAAISATVKAGYMVRASADWNVRHLYPNLNLEHIE